MRALVITKVVFEDSHNPLKDDGITSPRSKIKAILAITVGVVKSLTLWRAEKPIRLLDCIEIDDVDFVHHYSIIGQITRQAYIHGTVRAVPTYLCGDIASFPSEGNTLNVILYGPADYRKRPIKDDLII